MTGLCLADTLCKNVCGERVGDSACAEVADTELKGINTCLGGVITQFYFGFVHNRAVVVVGNYICIGCCRVKKIGKSCALLSYGVGQSVFVDGNIRRGHEKSVYRSGNFLRILLAVKLELFDYVLTKECGNTRYVRRSHRSTRNSVIILTGNGRKDRSAVGCDLGLYLKVGSRTPG